MLIVSWEYEEGQDSFRFYDGVDAAGWKGTYTSNRWVTVDSVFPLMTCFHFFISGVEWLAKLVHSIFWGKFQDLEEILLFLLLYILKIGGAHSVKKVQIRYHQGKKIHHKSFGAGRSDEKKTFQLKLPQKTCKCIVLSSENPVKFF